MASMADGTLGDDGSGWEDGSAWEVMRRHYRSGGASAESAATGSCGTGARSGHRKALVIRPVGHSRL